MKTKLPRMTAPPFPSHFTAEFKPHFCCVRLTCNACGRPIKPEQDRMTWHGLLVHSLPPCLSIANVADWGPAKLTVLSSS